MECNICLLDELAPITAVTAVTAVDRKTIQIECNICLLDVSPITAVTAGTADGRRNHTDGMKHLPVRCVSSYI